MDASDVELGVVFKFLSSDAWYGVRLKTRHDNVGYEVNWQGLEQNCDACLKLR